MKYLGKITDNKDLVTKEYVDAYHLPIKSKTYTNFVASANNDPNGWYYFGTVTPDNNDYSKLIYVKYRIRATANGRTDAYTDSTVEYYFYNNSMLFYRTDNAIKSTSYRPFYNHIIYRAKQAGLTAGYGHLLGVRLHSSWNPTTAANARTIVIDVLETRDCSVNFFDSMLLYANVPGTGSTNYDGRNEYNGTDQGDRHTGDANDTTTINFSTSRPTAGTNGIYQYNIIMMRPDGTWESLTAASGTGTSKAKNTNGFVLGQMYLYWSSTNISAGSTVATSTIKTYADWVDFRYTSNCGTTLTSHKMIYLKGTITNGLFYLADTWWTQTLPTSNDGFLYIPVGFCYGNGYSFDFWGYHGAYYHNGTTIVEYIINAKTADNATTVNGHTVNADVPSGAKFTDTVTTATTSGNGNAVTAISASNGALTVTKGTTFLTSHQDISGKADKSATVSTVTWDSTNKKLTKTINGTTSDVVTAATLRTGLNVADGAEVNQNAFSNVKVGSTTVAADSKTDTLELVAGSNVSLTPDATNDKVTIGTTGLQSTLVSGTNIKTINNQSLLGSGNITIEGGGSGGVTGVKGNSESSYRSGNVNLTLSNLGIHISTSDPTTADGNDGDVWIKYTASE